MKKLYFLFLVLFLYNNISAQSITFGSPAFKNRLLAADTQNGYAKDKNGNNIKIDSNGNKEIEISEALEVYYLDASGNNTDPQFYNIYGIEYFTNLRSLNYSSNRVSGADLRTLIYLEDLDCSYNTDFPVGINLEGLNLKKLNASGTGLMKPFLTATDGNVGLSQFPNLETLICNSTVLTSINLSGLKKLKTLDIGSNLLTNLNLSELSSLENLYCSFNSLTELDLSACKNLVNVIAYKNKFASLSIKDMPKLENLELHQNSLLKLANFENLPALGKLTVYDCALTSLSLSDLSSLKQLNCSNNKLVSLNLEKCPNLKNVTCNFNTLLTTLNISALENLETLNCSNTSLTALDLKNNLNLEILTASQTKVEFLDLSPLKKLLDVSLTGSNSLLYLLLKNGRTYKNYFLNAPKLKYLCVDDENIEYYKQVLTQSGIDNCEINTYCSFVSGKEHYIIKGINKYNVDNKGCTANNSLFSNIKYTVANGSNIGDFYSTKDGSYSIAVQEGTVTITPNVENPEYFVVSPSFVNVTFPAQSSPFIQDFCISSNGNQPDLEVVLIPIDVARPGFDSKYKIVYRNKGNITQAGVVNFTFNNDILDLIASNPLAESKTYNKLSWNFTDLTPFATKEIILTLKVNRPTDTPAVNNGDVLKYTVAITSQNNDKTPLDNNFTLNQTVVGSYDPNDKTCLEGSIVTPDLIGDYVHYMIRFENTGTYPAQNIVVKDIIDLSKFDISTLIPTSSSHSFVTKISDGNKVEFIFENINLPFDNASNDGYIAFKIKTKPTLTVGDSFTNDANIYFDYNFPILTNKATSTFKTTLATKDFAFSKYFVLHPNPSSQILNISKTDNIDIESFEIYDVLGQLLIAVPNAKATSNIDISKLRTGNYFIRVKSDKGSSNMKFIKN
ncbi:Internalin-related protein [Flavobacterium anhuiense]|uniref:Internalin-related protein n=1 Tax=Flavobacterium anhuiense TaxID=459526 RepID=A0A444VYR6_9FLAO|nr:T9SS type A sorting domain-containing protein [Flavobacterium anhuiense]RYJ38770.1 Internalin-related protein [Flavobacterium anhuiense]